MKEIILANGQPVMVDDEDYNWLNQYKWNLQTNTRNLYARRYGGGGKRIMMHRDIMDPPDGMDVDHIDHNGLNNQKSNLRICTRSQNLMNARTLESKLFKGTTFARRGNKIYYRAQIRINGTQKHLGYFKTEEEAAQFYNHAALRLRKEFAVINEL